MAQTREEIDQTLAERLCWQAARRDDSRVARRLYRKQVVDGVYQSTLAKIFVTYVAREADRVDSSSLRNMADVSLFTQRALSCRCTAPRARQADPGETRSSELSTSVTEIFTFYRI
jgi:hypothetical protein